jgi:hypothetical protein
MTVPVCGSCGDVFNGPVVVQGMCHACMSRAAFTSNWPKKTEHAEMIEALARIESTLSLVLLAIKEQHGSH